MKISFYLVINILIITSLSFSQEARNFFPQLEGYLWYYKTTPLNEASQKIDSLSEVVVDSFANSATYFGREAYLVVTRKANRIPGDSIIYTDSTYLAFEGGKAKQYFSFLSFLNTGNTPEGDLSGLAEALSDWYTAFDFALGVGGKYDIFSKDTTVNLDGQNVPLRIEIKGERNSDEDIQTEIGKYTCRKFVVRAVVSLLVTIFPFPPVAVPFLELPISTWISEGEWIIFQYTPSVEVNLSSIGGPTLNIPGSQKVLTGIPTSVQLSELPVSFKLFQNYPNPFNPNTTIAYMIPDLYNSRTSLGGEERKELFVSLKVYDILGREIRTLVEETQKPGYYEVGFDAANLASGIYLYRLRSGETSVTKKMVISK